MKPSASTLFTASAGLAVLAAIIAGFMIIGSPEEVRLHRLDEQRVRDLRALSSAIEDYWRKHASLPKSLTDVQGPNQWRALRVTDATSGQPYGYEIKDKAAYELCAEFDTSLDERNNPASPAFWRHKRGRHCFSLDAKPPLRTEPSPPR